MEVVLKYAESLERQADRAAPHRERRTADDLVQAAIVRTLEGKLNWDPAARSLEQHLMRGIASDVWRSVLHARRFPRISLDDDTPDDLEGEVSDALAAERGLHDDDAKDVVAAAMASLRERVAKDSHVLQLIDAFERGIVEKQEVLTVTGLSDRNYHNARHRLIRIARCIPTLSLQAVA